MNRRRPEFNFNKNIAIWLFITLAVIIFFNLFTAEQPRREEINFTTFLHEVETGKVRSVLIQGEKVIGTRVDGTGFRCYVPFYPELVDFLKSHGVIISAKPKDETSFLQSILISWFPMLLLIGVWIFFMRQMQTGGKVMTFAKSRARIVSKDENKVTFKDVAGIEEVKEELGEIIDFLKDPEKFTRLGGRIPKGVLLVGPPGTGKTLLAKAIAGEADVPFFSISGSDFVEMFVGVGAARVRDLFNQAHKNSPCIIFIDEIDAVGRQRGAGIGGGHDEREQTLNQLLVEMDGFEPNEGVIVIAATNRPDVLDPALLRPGRFDRRIVVPLPDVKGREGILKVHTKDVPLAEDVDLSVIAKSTPGFSGADLENLVNEAALIAARVGRDKVTMEDFERAKDKILMGVERRNMAISSEEKKRISYHEAGHTLVAKMIPGTDPVHKVTIIPRGLALGVTQQLPQDDRHTFTREYLLNTVTVLLGGRAAEELVLGDMTTGAGNDIERATDIVRKMVCEWGMSEKLGPLSFGKRGEEVFLGRDFVLHKDYSEETARKIDEEVERIVRECYERAKSILQKNMDKLHRLAEALLEKEVLDGKEIDEILFGGEKEGAAAQA